MKKSQSLVLPSLGEGVHEANIVRWIKSEGDSIAVDDAVLEISTDKVDTEVSANVAGFLRKQLFKPGDTVKVGATLALIMDDLESPLPDIPADASAKNAFSETSPAKAEATARPPHAFTPTPAQNSTAQSIDLDQARGTPLAQKMAQALNLNLFAVKGTGLSGKVTRDDLMRFIEEIRPMIVTETQLKSGLRTETRDGVETLDGVVVRREKMSKMRRLISEHMTSSVKTSPHVSTMFEIDMQALTSFRKESGAAFLEEFGFKLSFTHLISYITVQTLKEFPALNVSVDGNDLLFKDDINLGVAVGMGDKGLIVPVVKRSQDMSFSQFVTALQQKIDQARSASLQPSDVMGGTFTISNPGLFGCLYSNPIINQPQVAIMSLGAIIDRPTVIAGEITIRPQCVFGLTFDHRAVDGEGGAKFLRRLKEKTEGFRV